MSSRGLWRGVENLSPRGLGTVQTVCRVTDQKRQKGRVYRSCVQSVMVYASETWAVRVEEEQRMERNENIMLGCSHFEG